MKATMNEKNSVATSIQMPPRKLPGSVSQAACKGVSFAAKRSRKV